MRQNVRDLTEEVINKACQEDEPVLVEAPPASGKTHNAVRLAADSGHQVLYLAGRTDLYEQAIQEARDFGGIQSQTIPSPYRDCNTFVDNEEDGNDGDTKKARRMYNKGVSGEEIHYLGWDTVYIPCHTEESPCSYITKRKKLENKLDEIDLLIGNHQHAYNKQYLKDRIVIFDEFNPDGFISKYSSSQSSTKDDPNAIIEAFVTDSEGLPFDDFTDIIEARAAETDEIDVALDWFRENGATRETVDNTVTRSPSEYNYGDKNSALLTCALLIMENLGSGMEFAWEPDLWDEVDREDDIRCIRDRNTGEMLILDPPDLNPAKQVIGLDALPVQELWESVYGCDFERYQVIDREDLDCYLEEELGTDVIQVTDAKNPYSTGRISSRDEQRLQVVRTLENQRYPIITRKRALSEYRTTEWFEDCIEQRDGELRAKNYATVLSSNAFEDDTLGLVSGNPYPGDDVVKRWAALCGEATEPEPSGVRQNPGPKLTGFSGFGDEIYRHFNHHQVLQAIFRFGRSNDVEETSTVYLNTSAVPDWMSVSKLQIHDHSNSRKLVSILEVLLRAKMDDDSSNALTIKQICENACDRLSSFNDSNETVEISNETVRQLVSNGEFAKFIDSEKSDRYHNPRVFQWTNLDVVYPFNSSISYADHLLELDSKIVLLQLLD